MHGWLPAVLLNLGMGGSPYTVALSPGPTLRAYAAGRTLSDARGRTLSAYAPGRTLKGVPR